MAAHRLPPKILNGLQSFLTFSCLDELESCFYFWFWRRVCKCLNITAFRTDGVYAFQRIGSIMFDRYDKRFLSAPLLRCRCFQFSPRSEKPVKASLTPYPCAQSSHKALPPQPGLSLYFPDCSLIVRRNENATLEDGI